MKNLLTPEESQHLIDLGVDPKMASYSDVVADESGSHYVEKLIFSLADILSILPKEIEDCNFNIISTQVDIKNHQKVSGWMVTYIDNYNDLAFGDESLFQASELIDALYSLLVWCLEQNIIKTKED